MKKNNKNYFSKEKIISFYIFSGTGNTLLIVKNIIKILKKNGFSKIEIHRIEKIRPENIKLNNRIIGLAFPVAFQGTYPIIWNFVKSLPEGKNTPIFMVDTLDTFSGGVVGPIKKILKKKGYIPIGAKEIKMPNNILIKKLNNDKISEKIKKGLKKSEKYALNLINGKSKWKRVILISSLISLISKAKVTYKLFRKYYKFEIINDKCIKCGICIRLCPVQNITGEFRNNKLISYPIYKTPSECISCQRCFSFCPERAIIYKGKNFIPYHAVKLNELEQPEKYIL